MNIPSLNSLHGANVVIFGGSSGIGLATAITAKVLGANITIVGRTREKLERAAKEIGGAQIAIADIANRKSVEAVFAGISHIDHLVLTSGNVHAGKLAETDPDELMMEVNEHIAGTLYAVKAATLVMPSTGSIVLMGGQFSDRPSGNGTAIMAMACRGIEALARSLALEFQPIRINVISPGFIDTPLYDAFGNDGRAALLEHAANILPVGRIGQPSEVANAITFLLTNGYMNCEVLHIDGGGRFV